MAAVLKSTGQKPVLENRKPLPVVPSGSATIDDLIGGTLSADKSGPKCPGYPRRKITEIYGAESSGKTTAAIQAIAATQKQGGVAMFLDFEHALDHQYARRVGMSFDPDKLLIFAPETMEQGWKMIDFGLQAGLDLIVVDSVASMVPQAEMEKPAGDTARIGAVASSLSTNLPKLVTRLASSDPKYTRNPQGTAIILLNQTRANIQTGGYGGGGGDNDSSSGGKALKFYCSVRLKFTRIRSESVKGKDKFTGKERTYNYGNHTQVKLVKSKIDGKQGFTADIFIRYNYGIDDFYSLIEAGVTNKIISKSGSTYDFKGLKFVGRDKTRKYFIENPKAFAELRTLVLNAVRDDALVSDDEASEDDVFASLDETTIQESSGGEPEDEDDLTFEPSLVEESVEAEDGVVPEETSADVTVDEEA